MPGMPGMPIKKEKENTSETTHRNNPKYISAKDRNTRYTPGVATGNGLTWLEREQKKTLENQISQTNVTNPGR